MKNRLFCKTNIASHQSIIKEIIGNRFPSRHSNDIAFLFPCSYLKKYFLNIPKHNHSLLDRLFSSMDSHVYS